MSDKSRSPGSDTAIRHLRGKRVLVTGVCGTVGKELAKQLIERYEVGALFGLDHNETELMLLDEQYGSSGHARFILTDIRDREALLRETRGMDVIFHAAAYKHVYICERSPLEAIQTNILGVQNVIQASIENGVKTMVFTSSDKAVNPTNVMGTSKLMGERLMTAAGNDPHLKGRLFLSTRFGNVLGSRGSVVPVFREQIRRGGPVTLTDPNMTRFIMSLDQAVRLVIESAVLGHPGDVLITKMPAVRISDLAAVMVRECAAEFGLREHDIEIKVIGPKPGEKMQEELMNEEEVRRSIELGRYFVVRPTIHRSVAEVEDYDGLVADHVKYAYQSSKVPVLNQAEISAFLRTNGLVEGI